MKPGQDKVCSKIYTILVKSSTILLSRNYSNNQRGTHTKKTRNLSCFAHFLHAKMYYWRFLQTKSEQILFWNKLTVLLKYPLQDSSSIKVQSKSIFDVGEHFTPLYPTFWLGIIFETTVCLLNINPRVS